MSNENLRLRMRAKKDRAMPAIKKGGHPPLIISSELYDRIYMQVKQAGFTDAA